MQIILRFTARSVQRSAFSRSAFSRLYRPVSLQPRELVLWGRALSPCGVRRRETAVKAVGRCRAVTGLNPRPGGRGFVRMSSRTAFDFGRFTDIDLQRFQQPCMQTNFSTITLRLIVLSTCGCTIAGLTTAAPHCRHILAEARRVVL